MTNKGEMDSPLVEVIAATHEQQPILANLLELYGTTSASFGIWIYVRTAGLVTSSPIGLYWSEPGRHAFLIRADGKLAGLTMV